MPWPKHPNIDVLTLQRENDALRTTILCLKREIENKAGHVQRLEALLCSRLQKIDELNAKLDQAREQIKRLNK
jgi:predicted RNase H-like nuclease (RuvC/YqgF family)